jgi:hypothetical protein
VILILNVPWYRPHEEGDRLMRGLPLWTWITVACAAALAAVDRLHGAGLQQPIADHEELRDHPRRVP